MNIRACLVCHRTLFIFPITAGIVANTFATSEQGRSVHSVHLSLESFFCLQQDIQHLGAPERSGMDGRVHTQEVLPGNTPWSNVPILNWNRDNRKVKLNANSADNSNSNYCVPVFRESMLYNKIPHEKRDFVM